MNTFMNHNFNIERICIACFVPEGKATPVHKNRPSHGLAINLCGMSTFNFSTGKKITISEREIIYLPKGTDYTVTTQMSECYAVNFMAGDISFEPFKIKTKNHQMFVDCFKRAEMVWGKKPAGYEMKAKAELYNIIFALQQEYFTEYAGSRKGLIVKPAIDYIHNNYTKELISVEELAALCGITASYMRNIFVNLYGIAPVRYINNLKITRAKELIDSGLYSISEAAFMSGFSDLSHFSREFKKWEGVSPKEYSNR